MSKKLIPKHQNSAGPLTYNKPKLLDEEKESAQFLKNWFTNSNRLEIYNNNVREVIQDDINYVKGWHDDIINDDYVPETDDLNDAMKKRINRFNMLINNMTARLNKEHKRLHLASLDNTSSQLNKNINSAINIPRYVYGESNSPYQTELDLQFSNPNIRAYYSLIHNYIAYRPDTVKKSAIHEMTHASHLNASETKIKKIIKDLHKIKPINSYYDNPNEIYARLMLLREHLNIDPNKKWTIEEIQDLQNKQHDTLLDFGLDKFSYPPEILLQFFNDVAHNNSSENTLEPLYAKKGKKLIPKHEKCNHIYEEDWSDKIEPWAAGIGLAADAVGLGTAVSGVGAPVGATIALVGNLPNLVVDGYLFSRDVYRSVTDGGTNNIWSAVGNGGELALDLLGMKMISALNKSKIVNTANKKVITSRELEATTGKGRVGTGAGRVMARKSAERKAAYNTAREAALKESMEVLAKKGIRPVQGLYFLNKLADEMASKGFGVSFAEALKSAQRTAKLNAIFGNVLSGSLNTYTLIK